MLHPRFTFFVRLAVILSLVAFAAFYVVSSIHWPMVEDPPIMHYVHFLMTQGMRPYAEITDNNMPGAYLTEGWAMHLFGWTDLAWRVYDFALLTVFGVAAVIIARPYDWLAGYLAWGMFLLVHAADGPRYTGQREEVIAVLLMAGCAALFEAVRRERPWPALLFGLCTALAASIKPTFAPLPPALLAVAAFTLHRRSRSFAGILRWASAGIAAVAALILFFFLHSHALGDFLVNLRVVTSAYRALAPASAFALIVRAYPLLLLPVLLLGVVLAVKRRPGASAALPYPWYFSWEQAALLVAALAGLLSYVIQHKGFYHHRYTWIAFCFLLCALQISRGLRGNVRRQGAACAALLFVSLVCVPLYARLTTRFARGQDPTVALQHNLEAALEQDLTTLAGGDPAHKLQRQILCFDLVSGCLSALYHLRLVESYGFTGDLLFFRRPLTPPVVFAHELFWQSVRRTPPNVLIITTEWFGERDSFAKMDTWPEFVQYVQTNFVQIAARRFATSVSQDPANPEAARAYRIYVRKGSAILLRGAK